MNVDELWALSAWVEKEIEDRRVREHYNTLAAILKQNTQPNQPRQSFESQKNELVSAINQIDTSGLTSEQLAFLNKLGIAPYIGSAGVKTIEDILFRHALDIATAANRFQEITATITSALQKFKQIRQGLEDVVDSSREPLKADEVLVRVTFTGDAKIANVVDFKEWASSWLTIGRGIAMANGATPEDFRVVGASRGSIVVEMATTAILAKSMSFIILEALKVASRVLDILKQVETVKAMHLTNKKIAQDLKKEAEKERADGTAAILKKATQQLGLKSTTDQGDKVNALEASVKALVGFITKGGEVDYVMPDGEQQPDQNADTKKVREQLLEAFKEIRLLESKVHLIEHDSEEAPPAPDDADGDNEASA